MSSWKSLLLRIGENCPEYDGITDFKDHIETCSGVVQRDTLSSVLNNFLTRFLSMGRCHSNREWANGYNVGEKEQWCLSTLGYVKAFSRQYAAEIRPHIEKLDAEVFTENVHPLFRKAVYSGLNRPLNDLGSGQ